MFQKSKLVGGFAAIVSTECKNVEAMMEEDR